jgi:alkanesulfonate monooxygenase SsuD/methylene tetrahydromethanopterin reductase-like flavin-dependent oxidoreductase (luciferase family)
MGTKLALGLVLPMFERPDDGAKPAWADISAQACRAEELGADAVWVADEILWRVKEWPGPRGFWDCLTVTGAVAATTSTVKVGTWVMSAVQQNP